MPARDMAEEVRRVVEQLHPRPRLRYDKVALRFIRHLQASLKDFVPENQTLVLTITAPIRQASKTAAELEEKIRAGRQPTAARLDFNVRILENRIRVRLIKGAVRGATNVIGFVHNPESDPGILFETARSQVLSSAPPQRRG